MNNSPLVSVIVPVYKVEKYIKECIDSIRNQTLSNIEIILVDDGSPDLCPQICDQYAELDNRIKVIHKENGGLGFARNSGLNVAKGIYICFVDSDDFIGKDRLEKMYQAVNKSDADVCLSGMSLYSGGKCEYQRNPYGNKVFGNEEIDHIVLPSLAGHDLHGKNYVGMSVCRGLYKREIIEKNNIRFYSERQWVSEDIIFDMDLYHHVKKVIMIDICSYYYRKNAVSLTHTFDTSKFKRYDDLYEELLRRSATYSNKEELIQRIQYTFIFNYKALLQGIVKANSYKGSKKICKEVTYRNMIVRVLSNYPIMKLPIRKKTFCLALKYHCYRFSYLMLKLS